MVYWIRPWNCLKDICFFKSMEGNRAGTDDRIFEVGLNPAFILNGILDCMKNEK